jgi:hypothetical protein
MSYESDIEGNRVLECVAQMMIPKGENRDEDIFQKYRVVAGARVYDSDTKAAIAEIPE